MRPWFWYKKVMLQYTDFSGRARRREYWEFVAMSIVISIGLGITDALLFGFSTARSIGILTTLYNLAIIIPSLAVAVRRLHDTGRSGWWLLASFIPIAGIIVILIFLAQKGHPRDNEYGPDPKGDVQSSTSASGVEVEASTESTPITPSQ